MSSSDGHAPGVSPGVPVLTDREANFLDVFLDSRSPIGIPGALDASPGLVACGCMAELRYQGMRVVSVTDLGRRALAAHRLGIATRASFTIRNGGA